VLTLAQRRDGTTWLQISSVPVERVREDPARILFGRSSELIYRNIHGKTRHHIGDDFLPLIEFLVRLG
jgi:hypothetical protein